MSGNATRRAAVKAVSDYAIPDKDFSEPLGELFGKNVFGPTEMKARLPKKPTATAMQAAQSRQTAATRARQEASEPRPCGGRPSRSPG